MVQTTNNESAVNFPIFVDKTTGSEAQFGGYKLVACMRSPDGTRHCRHGIYREIVPPARLVFTYAWEDAAGDLGHETLVTVTFADAGRGKTRLTLHQALFETESARDAHQGGWASCMERFAAYLAGAAADH